MTIVNIGSDFISGGTAPLTRSITVGAGSTILVVSYAGDNAATGITFNGVAMTNIITSGATSLWYLASPYIGTANLVVTHGAGYCTVGSSWWSGTVLVNGAVAATSKNITVVTTDGSYVVDSFGWTADEVATKPSNATEIGQAQGVAGGASYAPSSGSSTTMNWVTSAVTQNHVAVNLVSGGGQVIIWSSQ